jgi:hypothetical protein
MADPFFAFIARCDCRDCRREREQAGKLRPRDARLRDREAEEDVECDCRAAQAHQ